MGNTPLAKAHELLNKIKNAPDYPDEPMMDPELKAKIDSLSPAKLVVTKGLESMLALDKTELEHVFQHVYEEMNAYATSEDAVDDTSPIAHLTQIMGVTKEEFKNSLAALTATTISV